MNMLLNHDWLQLSTDRKQHSMPTIDYPWTAKYPFSNQYIDLRVLRVIATSLSEVACINESWDMHENEPVPYDRYWRYMCGDTDSGGKHAVPTQSATGLN